MVQCYSEVQQCKPGQNRNCSCFCNGCLPCSCWRAHQHRLSLQEVGNCLFLEAIQGELESVLDILQAQVAVCRQYQGFYLNT